MSPIGISSILLWTVKMQRGAEAVMEHLGQEAHAQHVRNVLFLMPCHATPFYSSLHSNLPMRFLDCSPRHIF
jgi:phosphatidylinositol glycan class B